MINSHNRFDEYAYRIAYRLLDPAVTALEEGQWITIVGDKVVISDGTTKSFICISSNRDGRDQMGGKAVKKAAYLMGTFELSVTNFDAAKTYGDMTALMVVAGGILAPTLLATDIIAAYSLGAPVAGVLRICSAN